MATLASIMSTRSLLVYMCIIDVCKKPQLHVVTQFNLRSELLHSGLCKVS